MQKSITVKPASMRQFLVLMRTTTPEKIEQYNAVARLLHMPFTFVSFKELVDFHSPDELQANRVTHARDKNPGNDIELLWKYKTTLKKLCASYGIPYDPQNILVAAEDASLSLLKNYWKNAKNFFRKFVPADIVADADQGQIFRRNKKLAFMGPNTELGPFLSAMGIANFIKGAVRSAGKDDEVVQTLDIATLIVRPMLSDANDAPIEITKSQTNYLLRTRTEFKRTATRWIETTADFLHIPELMGHNKKQHHVTQTESFEKHLKRSPRGQIVKTLYEIVQNLPYAPAQDPQKDQEFVRLSREITGRPFKVRLMSGSKPNMPTINFHYWQPASSTDPWLEAISRQHLLNTRSNAYVFAPKSSTRSALSDPQYETCVLGYDLVNVLVDKQLEAPSLNSPVLLINNGILDSHLAVYRHMITMGMAKDHDKLPAYERNPAPIFDASIPAMANVRHKATGMIDIVEFADPLSTTPYSNLEKVAHKILERRRSEYRHFVGQTAALPSQGKEYQAQLKAIKKQKYRSDIFKVAVFTSASSDNLTLLNDNIAIGEALAEMGAGLVWGAGDRHGMGAVYDAYRKAETKKQKWIEGYSTPSIVVSETKKGYMPQCDYSEITPDIYTRMAKMIEASNVITITPGGFGTLQEMLAVFILMKKRPDLMEGKTVIIHNPDLHDPDKRSSPFWNPILETYLGKEATARLDSDFSPGKKIYMTATAKEHNMLVNKIKNEWESESRPKVQQKLYHKKGKPHTPS